MKEELGCYVIINFYVKYKTVKDVISQSLSTTLKLLENSVVFRAWTWESDLNCRSQPFHFKTVLLPFHFFFAQLRVRPSFSLPLIGPILLNIVIMVLLTEVFNLHKVASYWIPIKTRVRQLRHHRHHTPKEAGGVLSMPSSETTLLWEIWNCCQGKGNNGVWGSGSSVAGEIWATSEWVPREETKPRHGHYTIKVY